MMHLYECSTFSKFLMKWENSTFAFSTSLLSQQLVITSKPDDANNRSD